MHTLHCFLESYVPFEFFIAKRYLLAQRGMRFISITTWISILGVALGVAALIVVMGVMNGFTTDLRDKIIGVTSHIILFNGSEPIKNDPDLLSRINTTSGVIASTPFIYSELMISTSSGGKGVLLRGIDPDTAPEVLSILKKMIIGEVKDLHKQGALPGIIVGQEMAKRLGIHINSRVNMLAPSGQETAAGYVPKIKAFQVVGIFSLGMYEYDSTLAFVSLDEARTLLGWSEGTVTGIEVATNDVFKADTIGEALVQKLGGGFYAKSWMTMNANLFAALKLEKAAMAIILFLVVVVGAFSIITALVMMVMEKTKDIAILMSMGASSSQIRRIFITQGLLIGVLGTALGYAFGLFTCFMLEHFQFVQLPQGVYSLDYLPVLLEWTDLVFIGICAVAICFLATLYPASKASHLEPVEALRHE